MPSLTKNSVFVNRTLAAVALASLTLCAPPTPHAGEPTPDTAGTPAPASDPAAPANPANPADPADAADPAALALRQKLVARFPNTRFDAIERSAVPGLWEVWMGANVAYVTDEARHFVFGHLYDMQTQTDLTAARQERGRLAIEAAKAALPFANLPLADAITTVRGNGERKLAVFSDPHCPYCRELEQQLSRLDNVTIYTFLYPIASLHPQATDLAQSIWCASDRAQAWRRYMVTDKAPVHARCSSPIARNVALAARAGIYGTPFIIFSNGDKAAGALDTASLERRLARQ